MDPSLRDYCGLMNGTGFQSFDNHAVPAFPDHNFPNGLMNGIRFQSFDNHGVQLFPDNSLVNGLSDLGNGHVGHSNSRGFNPTPSSTTSNLSSISSVTRLENGHEDYDFSDSVLRYINQILMEEDVEGKGCMLQESLEHQALQDGEKSLYDIIGKTFPPEPDPYLNPYWNSNPCVGLNSKGLDCYFSVDYCECRNGIVVNNNLLVDPSWVHGSSELSLSKVENTLPCSYQTSVSSYSSSSVNNGVDRFVDSPISILQVPDLYHESQSISQFIKGVEEASKFLPDHSELIVNVDTTGLPHKLEEQCDEQSEDPIRECRGRKHSFGNGLDSEEERSSKQAATYDESDELSDMFDKVLLHHGGDSNELVLSLRSTLQTAATKKTHNNGQVKGSGGAKARGKKKGGRKEVVDLRTLLMNCAQAVAADDRTTANELIKQIRHHSSPLGDGNQRLAHYLADGLEARLAGTGSRIYKALTSNRITAADVLNAYLVYLAACPFRKLSNFFSNKNIAKRTRKSARIHIIDFGILYGFQWPTFIQRQSMREGGPPKIRITGIDFPQPGFRPAERVEETGRRLEKYAQEFKVPFEYRAIAKRWDTIQQQDFDIEEGEVLIVNCIYRMKNLPDETVSVESSRSNVLRMIRKLNPDVFIHGVVNGAYNAPFFVTRFREALFHFSAQFDMLETIVPREYGERMLIERDLLAREALNVIACEGWERVERPETYKQWQIRNMRAGFMQLPLDSEIKEKATMQVQSAYHKDFVIDEDSRWLLLGWKGRTIFALSTWKPT